MKIHPLERSLWYDTAAPAPETHPLEGAVSADVAVIGGGYTGLSTALHLAKRGVKAVVLEAEEAGYGASGRNASHCSPTFLHHTPEEVVAQWGPVYGPRMVRLQADAANLVFGLIREYGMECEAVQNGLIYPANTKAALKAQESVCASYAALGKAVRMIDKAEAASLIGSDRYAGGWFHPEGGHLNPLGYARGLARAALREGAVIHTGTRVLRVVPDGAKWRVETAHGSVTADKVVIGTNAFTGDFWPDLGKTFFRLTAFNVATEPLSENVRRSVLPGNNNLIDTRKDTQYYKLDKDGRLVTGSVVNWSRGLDNDRTFALIQRRVRDLFPQIGEPKWRWLWHGYVDMVPEMIPKFFRPAPGVVAALGFSGRGVPTCTALGKSLAGWAAGDIAEADLPLPFLDPKPLFGRRVLSFMTPTVAGPLYRWQDRHALRRDGQKPPSL